MKRYHHTTNYPKKINYKRLNNINNYNYKKLNYHEFKSHVAIIHTYNQFFLIIFIIKNLYNFM